MRGIIGGEQQVGLGQVLDVDEGIGGGDAVADAGGIGAGLLATSSSAWLEAASHASPAVRRASGV